MNRRGADFSAETARTAYGATGRASTLGSASSTGMLSLLGALVCALISGCTVGPDFKKPPTPEVSDYATHPVTGTVATAHVGGGEAQHLVQGADIAGDWWSLFHSKQLNDLIEQSLQKNPDLKSAQAALTVAHENVLAQRGSFFPSVSAGISGSRQQDPPGALAPVPSNNAFLYSLYTPQLSVSYVPDVFGLNRRTVESLEAQEQQVRFQMVATYNTLTANVVVAAITAASLQAQIDATRDLVASNAKMVEILKYRFSKGAASKLDVAAQESQLAAITATLPPLLKQMDQQRDQLAVLGGLFPSQASRRQI